jgi:hypothetical protein
LPSLIDSWPLTAAFVLSRNLTILASNNLARTLSRFFAPGENIVRAIFLEPELRMVYRDWEAMTTRVVPFLRAVLGAEPPDHEMVELVGELSISSQRFRTSAPHLAHAAATQQLHQSVATEGRPASASIAIARLT